MFYLEQSIFFDKYNSQFYFFFLLCCVGEKCCVCHVKTLARMWISILWIWWNFKNDSYHFVHEAIESRMFRCVFVPSIFLLSSLYIFHIQNIIDWFVWQFLVLSSISSSLNGTNGFRCSQQYFSEIFSHIISQMSFKHRHNNIWIFTAKFVINNSSFIALTSHWKSIAFLLFLPDFCITYNQIYLMVGGLRFSQSWFQSIVFLFI